MWILGDVAILEAGSVARGVLMDDRSPIVFREIGPGAPDEIKAIVSATLGIADALDGPVLLPLFGGMLSEEKGFIVEEDASGVPLLDLLGRLALPLDVALSIATTYARFARPRPQYRPSLLQIRIGWNGSVWHQVRLGNERRPDLRVHALLAPEEVRGDKTDDRTVVHNAALLTYWLVAGRHPLVDAFESTMLILRDLMSARAVPLEHRVDGVPRDLAVALHESLSVEMAQRPASWTKVLETHRPADATRTKNVLSELLVDAMPKRYRADCGFWEYARHVELRSDHSRSFRTIDAADDLDATLRMIRTTSERTD